VRRSERGSRGIGRQVKIDETPGGEVFGEQHVVTKNRE
jgi:hypothetical protein